MRRFIKNTILFTFFSTFFYCTVLVIYGKFAPLGYRKNIVVPNDEPGDFLFERLEDIKNYKDVDILFVGSSHASKGFDTRIFSAYGFRSFNLGSSGQTPVQSEIFLKSYLKTIKPKLVVLEVFPLMFESDGVESQINHILSLSKIDHRILTTISYKNVKVVNTLLYQKIVTTFTSPKRKEVLPPAHAIGKYIAGGFIEMKRAFHSEIPTLYKSNKWMPGKTQQQALDNIIRLLADNHTKLILVQTPVRKKFYNILTDQDDIDRYFRSKATYYNFNKLVSLNDTTDFFDSNHLNQSGVEEFNKTFITTCLRK